MGTEKALKMVERDARALVRYRTWAGRFFQGGATGCGCSIALIVFLLCGGALGHAYQKPTGDEIQSSASSAVGIAAVGVFLLLLGLGFGGVANVMYSMRKRRVLAHARQEVVEYLIQHVADGLVRPLWGVMKVLGDIGDETAAAALLIALQDPSKKARVAAAEALDKLGCPPDRGDPRRADYLLAREEWDKLEELGERALESLIRALGDKDTAICKKAAETLGKIGNEDAIPALNQATAHSDKGVKNTARTALARIETTRKR